MTSELHGRLFEDWEETKRWPKTFSLQMRMMKGGLVRKQVACPHRDKLPSQHQFYCFGLRVLKSFDVDFPVFYLGLGLMGLEKVVGLSIASFFKLSSEEGNGKRADTALSDTNKSLADTALSDTNKSLAESHRSHSAFNVDLSKEHTSNRPSVAATVQEALALVDEFGASIYFKCGECGKILLSEGKMEHYDYHVAIALSRDLSHGLGSSSVGYSASSKKEKKKVDATGKMVGDGKVSASKGRSKLLSRKSLKSFFKLD
jgi:hypothetical protein